MNKRRYFIPILFVCALTTPIVMSILISRHYAVQFENKKELFFSLDISKPNIPTFTFYADDAQVKFPTNFVIDTDKVIDQSVNTTFLESTQRVVIVPKKENIGVDSFFVVDALNMYHVFILNTSIPQLDMNALEEELLEYLDYRVNNYGIFVYDLYRNQSVGINETIDMPPASISKLPSVLLTLKDINAEKISFDSMLPLEYRLIHSFEDSLGSQPLGTMISIKDFIDTAIIESNNTAHYHLYNYLGGLDFVNARTQTELGGETFFLDPQKAWARSVGQVLINLYRGSILSENLTDYMLNLMKTTYPSLREGIPSGVPESVVVTDKVGFLFGGVEGITFSDAAIVYGENTDFVLVILNNGGLQSLEEGAEIVRGITRIVYEELD